MNQIISIVIPTYKRRPEMIYRAIQSVMNQSYKNLEIIIVDDSPSTYEFRDEVERFILSIDDKRIKYIQHGENLGANKARNTGIENSNGEFIAFLDDDDEWELDKLELQIAEFVNEEVGLVYCKARVISETDQTSRLMINEIKSGYYYKDLLRQNFIGSNSFVLIRKKALDEVGRFDENLTSNQDYDLFIRISKHYKVVGVDKVLVNYYIHGNERISTNPKKQLQGRAELTKKYQSVINQDRELKKIWKIKLIPLYFKNKMYFKAIFSFLYILILHPIFTVQYCKGTIKYRKRVNQSYQAETK